MASGVLQGQGVAKDGIVELYDFTFDALGSECTLRFYADASLVAETAADAVIAEVARIEARYSRYLEDSVLFGINRFAASGEPVTVDKETAALLDYAFTAHSLSGGLFDITSGILRRAWDFSSNRLPTSSALGALLPLIGMDKLSWSSPHLGFRVAGLELDLGGIGKEYAVDRAAAVGRQHGIGNGLIDLGGDIRVLGPHVDGTPWRIGIRDPRAPERCAAMLEVDAGAVATSGDYERYMETGGTRYCHILNPLTGWPAEGLRSVTVRAEQCMLAGTLATVAMLKGEAGKAWLAGLDVAHLWVDDSGQAGGNLAVRLA